jgi:glutathione S-transferase
VSATTIELIQFRYSHFNEKARWGLDWKGVPHKRRSLLPGPHMPTVRRLTGQTATPVVRFGQRVVHGSARILEHLEARYPDPPLLPRDPAQRRRALEIQAHFDDVVGPAVRCALFSELLDEPDYLCAMFASGKPRLTRALYRASFPLAKPLMRKANGVTSRAAIDAAFDATNAALDFVAAEAGDRAYLAGSAFSVADLAAASLLAVCTNPDHPDMKRPEPMPESVRSWLARWDRHPGSAWVREMYARHRGAPGATPSA